MFGTGSLEKSLGVAGDLVLGGQRWDWIGGMRENEDSMAKKRGEQNGRI